MPTEKFNWNLHSNEGAGREPQDDVTCRYCGADGQYVCRECKLKIRDAKRPKNVIGGRVTPEIVAEARRRLAKFESPTEIARTLGISQDQMRGIMQTRKKVQK